jgi:peptidylprolyl isomerase
MTRTASKGDKVKVHYTGSLDDGTVFDSSKERDPLQFRLGENQLITGFENAVFGMAIGEEKKVRIPAKDAYGDRVGDLVKSVDKKYLPKHIEPEVGMQLQVGENEEMTIVTIAEVSEKSVLLDANHPLAGKILNFQIELIDII